MTTPPAGDDTVADAARFDVLATGGDEPEVSVQAGPKLT